MCRLYRDSGQDQEKGFKVVFKKDNGNYYSVAMGFKYRVDRKIPIVKRQRRLSEWFDNRILRGDRYCGFSEAMKGRTAIFTDMYGALRTAQKLHSGTKNGIIAVVEATVSQDIMLGSYSGADTAAGRRIKFGKEVRLLVSHEGG